MSWHDVEGRFLSTMKNYKEDLRKECAEELCMHEDYIDMQVRFMRDCTSAQDYVRAIHDKNEELWLKDREKDDYYSEDEEDYEDDDYDDEYTSIDEVYVTCGSKVVAQNVRFIETYNIHVPDFIKNDLECKKQIKKTSKEFVIYDSVNDKRLFGDTLEECIEYATESVRDDRSKASMIHIVNRRFSKCWLVAAVCERVDGNSYKNIRNKQYIENLYEFEYAGSIHS